MPAGERARFVALLSLALALLAVAGALDYFTATLARIWQDAAAVLAQVERTTEALEPMLVEIGKTRAQIPPILKEVRASREAIPPILTALSARRAEVAAAPARVSPGWSALSLAVN